MLPIRVFLGLCALAWLPYGLYCLANPGSLAEAAGVEATSATGRIELRAMYGGLQAAIGALALAGALRPALAPHALLALAALSAGLGVARLAAAANAGEFSQYTVVALGLEWTMLVLAFAFWRRVQPAVA